jgi:hypothetical protein
MAVGDAQADASNGCRGHGASFVIIWSDLGRCTKWVNQETLIVAPDGGIEAALAPRLTRGSGCPMFHNDFNR